MDTNLILTGAIAVVLLFLILKFSGKIFKFIFILLLIAGLGIFGYLYLNDIRNIDDLHAKYCNNPSDRKDSLKCVCIVQPIEEDFKYRLSPQKLESMDSKAFVFELSRSLVNKRSEIIEKLKENDALNLLDEFKKDIGIPNINN
jgi:acyl carrier protein